MKKFFLILLFPILWGCQQKNTPKEQRRVSPSSIEALAVRTFESLHPQLRSASISVRDLESMPVGGGDTLRLANFAPRGFLLFAAKDDNVTTLGFSDNGQLHMSDTVGNPALRMVMNNAGTLIPGLGKDDLNPGLPPNFPEYPKTIYDYRTEKFLEYAPSTFSYFGQVCPFDKYLVDPSDNTHIPVGCGPVAILGILSHYRLQGVNGVQVDWDWLFKKKEAFSQYTYDVAPEFDQFAKLAKLINEHCYLIRCREYTLSLPWHVSGLLERNGFKVTQKAYNSKELISHLQQNKIPVIMLGYSKSRNDKNNTTEKSAHYWVIDGLLRTETKVYAAILNTPKDQPNYKYDRSYTTHYCHCNWGWRGSCNGYFSTVVFNPYKMQYDDKLKPQGLSFWSSGSAGFDDYYNISIMKITRK